MSPKLTIAYESADASPAPAANPGDRIDAMFEAAEERHRAARRVVSMLLRALVYLGALLTTAVLLFLVGYILVNGVPYLTPSLFEWEYNSTNVSLMPALVNTLLMAALSLLMAVPVGVGSAIYLVEYAPRGSRFVAVVRTTAETLQGIPSIIYGLFGMLFFVTALGWGLSLLAGACTLAIMVLPVVMRTTEEALLAVPDAYREGGFGLGAGRLRTVSLRAAFGRARYPGRRDTGARPVRGRGGCAHFHGRLHRPDPELRRRGRHGGVRFRPHAGRAHVRAGQRRPARERDLCHGGGAAGHGGASEPPGHVRRQEDEQGRHL